MKYTENHRLGDVIAEHYQLLVLLSRFDIPLGFGDKSIRTVCAERNVDSKTFLAVVNYVATGDSTNYHDISILEMTKFLRLAHKYYTEYLFPVLREKVKDVASGTQDTKMAELVVKLFDSYVTEVRKHLLYEDNVIFAYADRLAKGEDDESGFRLSKYIRAHDNIDSKLTELKNIFIKYYPTGSVTRQVNHVLYDLFACEADLASHCDIEDNLMIPAVIEIETRRKAAMSREA